MLSDKVHNLQTSMCTYLTEVRTLKVELKELRNLLADAGILEYREDPFGNHVRVSLKKKK